MPQDSSARDTKATASELDSLAQQLAATTESFRNNPKTLDGLDKERDGLVESAEALLKAIKPPADPLLGAFFGTAQFIVVRLFIDWKVFETIPLGGSISYADLATAVDADISIIIRLSNMLVSMGTLVQTEPGRLAHSDFSARFAVPTPLTSLIKMTFGDHTNHMMAMQRYYEEYGRKEPTGRYHTIFAYAEGDPKLTIWEHLDRNPQRKTEFIAGMVAAAAFMPTTGAYDYSWVVDKAAEDPDRALVVDVGGGQGHALRAILQTTPGLPVNRCVLEDLAYVLPEAKKTASEDMKEVQYVPVDFHAEQPVKGALIYFIRRCLHDYGDDECVGVLKHLREAMSEDSRLLITEQVYTDPPQPLAAVTDLIMSVIGGKERSLEGFTDITERAGLKIVKVHPHEGSDLAVIECAKA